MNQSRGMPGWIRSAYDKLALFAVMFVLLLSVILLYLLVDREKQQLNAASWNQSKAPLSNSKPADTSGLHDAIEGLAEPFQMGWTSKRMMVAEARVACDQCGRPIPVEAEVCPYKNCNAVQKPFLVELKPADKDQDRMPDAWEEKYNLDTTLDDSGKDADGDRWTNFEEFAAGTNPRDPADHPPPVTKLRWIRTQWTTLPFSFQSVQHPVAGSNVFVLKNKSIERDYYVQLGDKIAGGYEVFKYEEHTRSITNLRVSADAIIEDVSVLTLRKGDKLIALTRGQDAQRGELAAELVYLIDNSKYPVKVNFVVSLGNNRYKVVDIQKNLVVVSDVLTGVKSSLEKYTDADRPNDAENQDANRP